MWTNNQVRGVCKDVSVLDWILSIWKMVGGSQFSVILWTDQDITFHLRKCHHTHLTPRHCREHISLKIWKKNTPLKNPLGHIFIGKKIEMANHVNSHTNWLLTFYHLHDSSHVTLFFFYHFFIYLAYFIIFFLLFKP